MSTAPSHSPTGEGHLRRVLGLPSLALFGLVYIVPLTVFTTYGIVVEITGGRLAVAYLVTLTAMVFTARSYARMAAAYPVAGSAYTYSQKSFGAPVGFLVGWTLLLDYLFLPMINYLVIGIFLNAAIPAVPPWVFVVVTIAVVTVLNIVGIVSVARANFLIIAMQTIFIAVFVVLALVTISGSGSVDLLAPLTGDGTAPGFAVILAGAAILCLSFLGFDAVSTLSEEAKDPTRSVPRAIMITTVLAGFIFFGLSYLAQLAYPSNEFTDVDSAALNVMSTAGGQFLETFFTAAYVAGATGSAPDLAGLGGQDPLRHGTRRDPAATHLRACFGTVRHTGFRDPGGVAGVPVGDRHQFDHPGVDDQFRCARCLFGREPRGVQAFLH